MALQTSPENPVPVRTASRLLGDWIRRLGPIWVEGQIAQLDRRRNRAFLQLHDTDADMSIPVNVHIGKLATTPVEAGHRIVALLSVDYWPRNGQVTWQAREIRPVGVGALMQRLEELRKTLAAEGLFADRRKIPLPFLPRRVGLICGKGAAAYHDVAVQGPQCVAQVTAALRALDEVGDVDVIVITRGGGDFTDLIGFSNESLLRAVSACRTPVVSAIGHEEDSPLLDLVADYRASTPTAAGKIIVPDAREEHRGIADRSRRMRRHLASQLAHERSALNAARGRLDQASPLRQVQRRRVELDSARSRIRYHLTHRIDAERDRLALLGSKSPLANPQQFVDPRRRDVDLALAGMRRLIRGAHTADQQSLAADTARLGALSPQATLDRGYAVVRQPDGSLITDACAVRPGQRLDVRVRTGSFPVDVAATNRPTTPAEPD
jgi:exodeoxyribonuclease VII large subunit